MKKRKLLAGMAVAVATFTLTGCTAKENKQKTAASTIEDTAVGICPCCEVELAETEDPDTTTVVMYVD